MNFHMNPSKFKKKEYVSKKDGGKADLNAMLRYGAARCNTLRNSTIQYLVKIIEAICITSEHQLTYNLRGRSSKMIEVSDLQRQAIQQDIFNSYLIKQ